MEHTETLIVEQLKTGNEDAYQYIYDRHYALLKRWRFPFPSVAIC